MKNEHLLSPNNEKMSTSILTIEKLSTSSEVKQDQNYIQCSSCINNRIRSVKLENIMIKMLIFLRTGTFSAAHTKMRPKRQPVNTYNTENLEVMWW